MLCALLNEIPMVDNVAIVDSHPPEWHPPTSETPNIEVWPMLMRNSYDINKLDDKLGTTRLSWLALDQIQSFSSVGMFIGLASEYKGMLTTMFSSSIQRALDKLVADIELIYRSDSSHTNHDRLVRQSLELVVLMGETKDGDKKMLELCYPR